MLITWVCLFIYKRKVELSFSTDAKCFINYCVIYVENFSLPLYSISNICHQERAAKEHATGSIGIQIT